MENLIRVNCCFRFHLSIKSEHIFGFVCLVWFFGLYFDNYYTLKGYSLRYVPYNYCIYQFHRRLIGERPQFKIYDSLMWSPERKIAIKLVIFTIFTQSFWSGFQFLSNQFIYYRFLKDAGLPYDPSQQNKSIPDSDNELRNEVQKKTAHLLPLLSAALLIPGLLSSFMISSLSDYCGRRFAMGVLFGGLISNVIISSFVILFEWNLYLLILGNLMCGFLGGGMLTFSGQISVCFADITKVPNEKENLLYDSKYQQASLERRRLLYMGIYDGVFIDHFGFITTCLALMFLCLLSVGVLWCLPETKSFNTYASGLSSFNNSFDASFSTCNIEFHSSQDSSWLLKSTEMVYLVRNANVTTILIFAIMFLTTLTTYNEGQYTFLYLMGHPFNWSVDQFGYFSGLSSTLLGLLSFILTWVTIRWMKVVKQRRISESSQPLLANESVSSYSSVHEAYSADLTTDNTNCNSPFNRTIQHQVLRARRRMIKYVIFGMLAIVISKFLMGLAFWFSSPGHNILVFVSLIICIFRSAVVPVLKSFTSSLFTSKLQSSLFSVIAISEYLGLLIGIATLPYIYAATVALCSGTVFFVSSGLSLIAFILLLFVSYYTKQEIRNIDLSQPIIIEVHAAVTN
ncbi:adenylate cyclase [Schistosoma japonicum]|nr:adenylate cyclase [Schistosoma japonicum]